MIINPKQVKRFARLYFPFIDYANDQLHMRKNIYFRNGSPNADKAYIVARAVWADGRNSSLASDYARDNPHRLSTTDLREIARWEHALAGVFLVQRRDRDMFFSLPGNAIAVRGHAKEIDVAVPDEFPTLADAILLPFENVVVFPFIIDTIDERRRFGSAPVSLFETEAITDKSRIIRSARDFVKYADSLQEIIPQDEEYLAHENGGFLGILRRGRQRGQKSSPKTT